MTQRKPTSVKDAPHVVPAAPKATPRAGITARAFLLGIFLIPLLIYWVEYTEIVSAGPDLAAMSLPMAVVFALLVLVGCNVAAKRFWPRAALSQAELLFIYTMCTVSIGVCGIGMMQFLTPMLAGPFYFATTENRWDQWIHNVPHWALPNPGVVPAYYNGKSTIFTMVHLTGWFTPMLVWSGFLCVLLFCMYCIASIFRRQWVESERLTFPIVQIPLEMTRDGGDSPLWRSKFLWIGVLVPVVLETLAVIHFTMVPTSPYIPIKPESALQIDTYVKDPPWNAIGYTPLAFYPLVVGLTYLVSLDVSFSCWFFYLATKIENVAATAFGFRDPGAGAALARVPYTAEQGVGAFIGLALFTIVLAWPHLKRVWKTACGQSGGIDDSAEPMSYRAAVVGCAVSAVLLVGFGNALGLSVWLSAAFFLLFFLFVLTFTRIRAEAGLPWGHAPWGNAHGTIVEFTGTQSFSQQELTGFTMTSWFDSDFRCLPMPAQMEAMKIAGSTQPRAMDARSLSWAAAAATVVAIVASWLACLFLYYKWGAASAHVEQWRTGQGHFAYDTLTGWLRNQKPIDPPRIGGAATGLVVVCILSFLRTRFVWWPLHPIGYAVGNTDTMTWIWFPTLLGWLAKKILLRYGGISTYRAALPFFIGLVFGDYLISGLWALFFLATGMPGYRTFPI